MQPDLEQRKAAQMLDFSAYLAAQQLTQGAVSEALADAPVRPHRLPLARRPGVVTARQWLSLTVGRLVDVIQPVGERAGSALPAGR
jgi:hypothetical protein